jgi:hypothetical protein
MNVSYTKVYIVSLESLHQMYRLYDKKLYYDYDGWIGMTEEVIMAYLNMLSYVVECVLNGWEWL